MFDCACFRSDTGNKTRNAAQNSTMQQPVSLISYSPQLREPNSPVLEVE